MKRVAGFTLVEMLIALSIFGMLTAAGVTLLSVTARTQATSDRLLAEVGEIRRVGALLNADLALAATRLHRDGDGRPQRAFAGGAGDTPGLLAFVRHGWDRGDGGTLQRVGYRLRDGRLERLSFRNVDGGGEAVVVPLLDGVTALRLRYRDEDGAWLERWNHSDETRLPEAIELVTRSRTQGTVRQLFLVGTGLR
jgi:general secretion pathway protein J